MGNLIINYENKGEYEYFKIIPEKKLFYMANGEIIAVMLKDIATEYWPDVPNNDIYIFT